VRVSKLFFSSSHPFGVVGLRKAPKAIVHSYDYDNTARWCRVAYTNRKTRRDMIRIVLAGYLGRNNIGSEARAVMTIQDVRRSIGEEVNHVQITALTLNATNTRRYISDQTVDMQEIGSIFALLPGILRIMFEPNDILFLTEGATFTDHFSSFFFYAFLLATFLAKASGKKVVAYVVECGELKPFNRRLLRYIGNKIDLIITRTEDSKRRMIRFGIKKPIHVTADMVFQYRPPDRDLALRLLKEQHVDPQKPIVAVAPKEFYWFPIRPEPWGPKQNLYHYPFYFTWTEEKCNRSREFKKDMSQYVDYLIEKLDVNVLLIAMDEMDVPISKEIHSLSKHPDHVRVISNSEYGISGISALLSSLRFLVATRYHACVLSIPSAIPLIGVSSDARLKSLFREMGIIDCCVDLSTKTLCNDLICATERVLENEKEYRSRIADAYGHYQKRVAENSSILRRWFVNDFQKVNRDEISS